MHPVRRDLALLLSLGALPIGCGEDKDPITSTTSTGPPSGPGSDPMSGPTSQTNGTTEGSATDSADAEATDPTLSPTTSAGSAETGEPPGNPECAAVGQHYAECYPRDPAYADSYEYYCNYLLDAGARLDGPDCVEALKAYFVCLSMQPCDLPTEPCVPESDALAAVCPSIDHPGETSA